MAEGPLVPRIMALHGQGMTVRAIGLAVGRSKSYVHTVVRANAAAAPAVSTPDKAVPMLSWREWASWSVAGQELRRAAAGSNRTAAIHVAAERPILVVPIADFHWGSWGADYRQIVAFTDEILATPDCYLALLGDMEQQAIKLRGVLEVADNLMPPEVQSEFTRSWLEEIGPRILFATWDNHAVERQEAGTGQSVYATMMKRRFVYFGGIGHVDLSVGAQTYRLAVSHRFRGSSINDPVAGPKAYLRYEGQDREIAIQGDTHRPGRASYYMGAARKLALNCGTMQAESGFAQRHFSLFSVPVFPCFELYPERHMINDYESLAHWRAGSRHAA